MRRALRYTMMTYLMITLGDGDIIVTDEGDGGAASNEDGKLSDVESIDQKEGTPDPHGGGESAVPAEDGRDEGEEDKFEDAKEGKI